MTEPIDDIEAFETRVRPRLLSSLLLWLIAAFFLIFVLWAALTEIDRSVRAQARVIPSSQLQVVSNLEGGIVSDILVATGQKVKQGQPLLKLSPIIGNAELGSGEASVAALLAKVTRLNAEVTGRTPIFAGVEIAGPFAAERALYVARQSELTAIQNAARARSEQAYRALAEAQATLAARQSVARQARDEAAMIRPLVEQGYEPRLSLMKLEAQAQTANSESAAAAAAVGRARAQIAEATAEQAQQTGDWRSRAATELAAANAELAVRQKMLPALSDRLRRADVIAPVSGRVNRVLVTTPGAAITPGSPLVEIVPSNDSLIIEALVKPKDIGSVKIGQPASVNITAYDSAVYGALKAVVISISPDTIVNEKTGASFYFVHVRTTAIALRDASGKPLPIGAGMTAEVNLLGEKRSILSYVFSPITKLVRNAFRE
jgi:membrane fusion protein, adhesin transport system